MQLNRKILLGAAALAVAVPGIARIAGTHTSRAGADGPAPQQLHLVVDLSDRRLKMYESDTLVWQYPISPGMPSYPTPPGEYKIRHLVWNPSWTPPPGSAWAAKYKPQDPGSSANPMKVVKIFFKDPDYYIHGTAETGRLGSPAS